MTSNKSKRYLRVNWVSLGQVKEFFKSVQIHLLFTPCFPISSSLQFLASPSLVMCVWRPFMVWRHLKKKRAVDILACYRPPCWMTISFFLCAACDILWLDNWRSTTPGNLETWNGRPIFYKAPHRLIFPIADLLIGERCRFFFILLYVNIVNSFWLWSRSLQQLQF